MSATTSLLEQVDWPRQSPLPGDSTVQIPATFVQLAGAMARPDVAHNAPDLVRIAAAASAGTASMLYAPSLMPEPPARTSWATRRCARDARLVDRLTRAVISIGARAAGDSTVYDALEPEAQQSLRDQGVVAERASLPDHSRRNRCR